MRTRFWLVPAIAIGVVINLAISLEAQPDPMELLRKVQGHALHSVGRLPRYMCTQTIDRLQQDIDVTRSSRNCEVDPKPENIHLTTSDRLRLDVAMAVGFEMYSWVHESRFGEGDLLDIVREGAISTGAYSAFLSGIFGSEDANFTYNGETTFNGLSVTEFGFRVPVEKSHYLYGSTGNQIKTGYDGTFFVDPKSGDLLRLVVRTNRLPPSTGACYGSTTLDYTRVRLKDNEFLLPKEANLRIVHPDGVSDNRTVFSGCHEFLGESTVRFDAPPGVVSNSTALPTPTAIPAGYRFQVQLLEGFDSTSAATGDPVKAKLIGPMQNDAGKVLVPAGATVGARVVRFRQFYGKAAYLSLEVKLETVEVNGVAMRITAAPHRGLNFGNAGKNTLKRRVELGTIQGLAERSVAYKFSNNPKKPYLIRSGLESSWITVEP